MFRDFVSGTNCDGGSNALGQFVKTAEGRERFSDGKNEIPETDDGDFEQIMRPSDRPNQAEIERFMSFDERGPPMFQNDEDVNEFLSMNGEGLNYPWMDNFWGNFVPTNAANTYNYEFNQQNNYINHPSPFQEGYVQTIILF